MASPVVAARAESSQPTNGTTHPITLPANSAGELLVVLFAANAATTVSPAESFASFEVLSLAAIHLEAFYVQSDGSQGTAVTFSTSGSVRTSHLAYRITGHADPATRLPEATQSNDVSSTPDPPNIIPTGGIKDYLFIACLGQAGEEADDDTWVNSAPSGYGNLVQKTCGTAGAASANCSIAGADRSATVSSEDPGTFSVDQSLAYVAFTIAIHPGGPAGSLLVPRREPKQHRALRDADPWSVSGWLSREERRIAALERERIAA